MNVADICQSREGPDAGTGEAEQIFCLVPRSITGYVLQETWVD